MAKRAAATATKRAKAAPLTPANDEAQDEAAVERIIRRADPTEQRLTFLIKSRTITVVQMVQVTVARMATGKANSDVYAPVALVHDGGALQEHHLIPASTARGKARRGVIQEVLLRTTSLTPWSLSAINMNFVGGGKGSTKSRLVSPTEMADFAARNPVIELWGCGDPLMVPGRVYVGHIVSEEPINAANGRKQRDMRWGRRGDPVGSNDYRFADLSEEDQQLYIRRRELVAQRAPYKKALKALAALAKKDRQEKKKQTEQILTTLSETVGRECTVDEVESIVKDLTQQMKKINADVSLQIVLPGYEGIPVGTRLKQTIFLNEVTRLAAGLWVAGENHCALRPHIGGKKGHGGGALDREYTVSILVDEDHYEDDCILHLPAFQRATITPLKAGQPSILQQCWDEWKACDKSQFDFEYPSEFLKAPTTDVDDDDDEADEEDEAA